MLKSFLLLGNIGTGEIVLIALIVLLLFGGKKIPELMRGLGKGVKSFKDGMADVENELKDVTKEVTETKEQAMQVAKDIETSVKSDTKA